MTVRKEAAAFALFVACFLALFFMPVGRGSFDGAVLEALRLSRWYAREHVLLCLVPAFFIAGAVSVFVRQGAVLRYLGPSAPRTAAYGVAAASGTLLAVCSCTVLPLFAGIRARGAGLGPASAFLYSGPAINVLAIILTARVLGFRIGMARAVGAVAFAVVIGLLMQALFHREEAAAGKAAPEIPDEAGARALWQEILFFASLVGILVFANWAPPAEGASGPWATVYAAKWVLTGFFATLLAFCLAAWFRREEIAEWAGASWGFARQILPLLFAGVFAAGFLLGGPGGGKGVIPMAWVETAVGGNSVGANLFAAAAGALMYFATLTEVPILEGLLAGGMGQGPALTLLLAGPALSLPNMVVIRSVLGTKRTAAFVVLVVLLSAAAGILYGMLPQA